MTFGMQQFTIRSDRHKRLISSPLIPCPDIAVTPLLIEHPRRVVPFIPQMEWLCRSYAKFPGEEKPPEGTSSETSCLLLIGSRVKAKKRILFDIDQALLNPGNDL
jgi:hypothetical protein